MIHILLIAYLFVTNRLTQRRRKEHQTNRQASHLRWICRPAHHYFASMSRIETILQTSRRFMLYQSKLAPQDAK